MDHTMHRTRLLLLAAALVLTAGTASCSKDATQADTASRRRPAATEASAPARPTKPIDRLVAVGDSGARMHLSCSGSGARTVVILPGFGDDGESWGAVTPVVSEAARVCTYARFGLGTSDAPPATQTFATEADDLHDLLQAAGEPGPYVVVGHSFGGAEAVSFAHRFASEVTGVLLVDASPADWPTALCSVPDDGSAAAASWRDTCTSVTHADQNPERLDGRKAFAEVAAVRSLGDLPVTVMTRAEVVNPDLPDGTEEELAAAWQRGQQHWASLSSSGRVVPVADTGHVIQVEQPAAVIENIEALVQAGVR
jgi:pimeloyl-ACP methyl ester carboxylesterase